MRPALGAVLVGGESRRYGSSKARARVDGEPMAARVAALLRDRVDPVLFVGGEEELAAELGMEVVPDRRPGEGPLAGVEAALAEARIRMRDGAFVVACDLPLLTAELVEEILGRRPGAEARIAGERGGVAVEAVLPEGAREGRVEPLCGWYAVGAEERARVCLAGADPSMQAFVEGLGVRRVRAARSGAGRSPAELFLNVNTPADRRRVEAILEGRR